MKVKRNSIPSKGKRVEPKINPPQQPAGEPEKEPVVADLREYRNLGDINDFIEKFFCPPGPSEGNCEEESVGAYEKAMGLLSCLSFADEALGSSSPTDDVTNSTIEAIQVEVEKGRVAAELLYKLCNRNAQVLQPAKTA